MGQKMLIAIVYYFWKPYLLYGFLKIPGFDKQTPTYSYPENSLQLYKMGFERRKRCDIEAQRHSRNNDSILVPKSRA